MWLHILPTDLLDHEVDPMLMIENHIRSSLLNPELPHDLSHREIKFSYIRDMMQKKIVYLQYLSTPEQTANIYLVKNSFRVKREYG